MSLKATLKRALSATGLASVLPSRTGYRERMALPPRLQIEPTTLCNLCCAICPNRDLPTSRQGKSMSADFYRQIVEQVPTLKEIKLQGLGEPLIAPDVMPMLEWGAARGIRYDIITNGMVATEKILQALPFVEKLGFSLDAPSEETNRRLRSGARVARIAENVRAAVAEKRRKGYACRIRLNCVVSHLNREEVPELMQLGASLGVDIVNLVVAENWKIPGDPGYESSRDFAREAKAAVDLEAFRRYHAEQAFPFELGLQDAAPRKGACYWGFTSAFVTCDGFVTPCCIRPDPRSVHFGNLHEEAFETIWNGDKMRTFRRTHLKDLPNPVCDHCPA
ncbi:MAG: SPASM domain-containing protein [Kiritimatiellae bacterium]|nr:SPASM domain-containing protein [Kiritimatiellia bacterium]